MILIHKLFSEGERKGTNKDTNVNLKMNERRLLFTSLIVRRWNVKMKDISSRDPDAAISLYESIYCLTCDPSS